MDDCIRDPLQKPSTYQEADGMSSLHVKAYYSQLGQYARIATPADIVGNPYQPGRSITDKSAV